MPKRARSNAVALLLAACAADAAADDRRVPTSPIPVGNFSSAPAGSLPTEWAPLTFRRISALTRYEPVADPEHGQVVMARAAGSASALIRRIDVDANGWPILRWRWKIDTLIAKADITQRDGDDYPARIYVSFRYDPARVSLFHRAGYAAIRALYGEYPPHAGLNYVWDGKAPLGSVVLNAHTSRVAMIVVESGAGHLRQWRSYERNIVDDYRRAFGEEPPPISGIAIMTDTDNTGESAKAWYGDISLVPAPR